MNARRKVLISGITALATLLSGCYDGYIAGSYEGPYLGGFGPYYPGPGPFYENDFIFGGVRYGNYYGVHHFYGRSFGARHFAAARGPVGRVGGHAHIGGGHR
jgi:hypothetical protein